ncbi:MAG: LD-carboxypeptidase [Flavobacteriaceae bacterium]
MIKPTYLQKGDTIAIVAPAGFLKSEDSLASGRTLMASWDLKIKVGQNVFKKEGHFAGSDTERLSDLQEALDNPKIKAIWCARGGYGTNRIIDQLDFTAFKKQPKWVIGYSDITILLNHINNLGIASLHTMMATSTDAFKNELAVLSLKNALFGTTLNYEIPFEVNNILGEAHGVLIGGNLSLLAASLGTTSFPNLNKSIVFIEEIGEYKYRIDRMLYSLKRHGVFKKCRGVLIGGMTDIPKNDPEFGKSINQLILDVIDRSDIPVIFGVPAGHIKDNCALILGSKIAIKATKNNSIILFK